MYICVMPKFCVVFTMINSILEFYFTSCFYQMYSKLLISWDTKIFDILLFCVLTYQIMYTVCTVHSIWVSISLCIYIMLGLQIYIWNKQNYSSLLLISTNNKIFVILCSYFLESGVRCVFGCFFPERKKLIFHIEIAIPRDWFNKALKLY